MSKMVRKSLLHRIGFQEACEHVTFAAVYLHGFDSAEHVEDFLDEVDELADAPKARVEEGEEHVLQSFNQIVQEHGFASFPFLPSTSVT